MSVQVEAPPQFGPLKRAHRSRAGKVAAKRKRTTPPATQQKMVNGMYVYSNPPRVLNMNPSVIRQWLRGGELDKLQQVVLEGQGHKLVGEYSPDPKVRAYLKTVPAIIANMEMLHDLVSKSHLGGMQQVLERDFQATKSKSLALCKDQSGVGLLHKAVYHDHQDIMQFLVGFNPATVHVKDKEGRTALHYCGHCKEPADCWALLTAAGADANLADLKGNTAAYYLDHPEQAALSEARQTSGAMKRFTSGKGGFVVTKANIRIWIHDRDLGRLQQMLWEGHGNKLRVETSNNPRVKRFLDAVPYIMGVIKDVHTAAVNNDAATLKKKSADPVPPAMLCSKDQHGLNPLHKAAGLGHTELVEYILERSPKAANMTDNEGKLPLHYAAAAKDNGQTYSMLLAATADERALDNRGKFPGYYKLKPGEADPQGRLRMVPDAPRTASTFPPAWDWRLLNNMTYDFGPISSHEEGAGEDSGHGAGNSASDDTLQDSDLSKLQPEDSTFGAQSTLSEMQEDQSHADDVGSKLRREEEEDEGVGREVEDEEEAEGRGTAAEEPENQDTTLEEAGGETHAVALDGAEDAEDAAGRRLEESEEGDQRAAAGGADEQPAEEEEEEHEEGREEDTARDAETGEREVEEPEQKEEEEEQEKEEEDADEDPPAAAQADRWERGESEEKEDEARSSASGDGQDTTEDQDETREDERPSTRVGGAVGDDAPEENVDDNVTVDNGDSNEEEASEEMKAEAKDAEIRRLIDSGNMEELAAMILNGEGFRLVGRASSDPELQGFLNNVPVYMNKIHAVHAAAREGRLRDLQAALDRRKFAVARDGPEPGWAGATPLHVATLFGHTSVLRYLSARFPETLGAVDRSGRTPLHYAAALRDNGHYYNMLLGFGADPAAVDHLGNTPEYYQQNADTLTHQQLLEEYGASEKPADSLADKAASDAQPAEPDSSADVPVIWTEEGRYLASTLGQPLMKGLTEVATNRPRDPIAYLAAYLYNYANRNKSRVGTQESRVLLASSGPGEEEEEDTPPEDSRDVLDLDDEAEPPGPLLPESAFAPAERDEHGQSMLHFAAARTHGRNALFQLLDEAQVNLGYRDALYRTARDVALQADVADNVREVDRWVLFLAARGETEKLLELMLEGYDHIIDVMDDEKNSVVEVVAGRSLPDTQAFLQSIAPFEERREQLHEAVRRGSIESARAVLMPEDGGKASLLAIGKSRRGRTCLHVAVLCQHEHLVQFIASEFPHTLWIGDNLERTPLHYAMALEKIESLSTILIKAGAVRVAKDLKGRQPTYYFMNKSEIVKLQEEEEAAMN